MEWPTHFADELLREAMKKRMAIVAIHSHPGGFEGFSVRDDRSDTSFFQSVNNLLEDGGPHASAVMLPDGRIFARAVTADGAFAPVGLVSVVGDDLDFWHAEGGGYALPEFVRRQAQAFGGGTVQLLRRLRIGITGCSGTGSPLIEQLIHVSPARRRTHFRVFQVFRKHALHFPVSSRRTASAFSSFEKGSVAIMARAAVKLPSLP